MKIPKPFLLLFAALLAFGALTPRHARAQVSVSFFYDTLDPYGEWVQDPAYGYCWHPTNVDENWAPYTDGYWAYTDSGWTWVSYEDYGGIVYHYGRWAHLPGEGWVWVPGNTWAPAWVSWRVSDSYVGWAPLPPEARWSAGVGFSTWVDARFNIGPGFFSFVSVGDFGAPALGPCIVNREQNVTIINNTTNITNITVNNSNVYTGGPSYAKYAALSKHSIPTLKLVRQSDTSLVGAQGGKALSHQQGNQLMVLAPKVSNTGGGAPPKIAKTLTGVTPDHGWDIVTDPDEREKLHARIKDEAGSNTSSPARPVNPDDIKLANEKIKALGVTKSAEAKETPIPKTPKTKKPNPEDISTLENAPATEEPGAATAAETPKTKKSKKSKTPGEYESASGSDETPIPKKSKKSRTPGEYESESSGDETPIPKKSRKSKTPGEYESDSGDYGTPSRHKKSSDSDLQPFMGGDESSESRPKKSSEEENYRGNASENGYPGATEKSKKKSKKESEEGQQYPPGQGQ